MNVSVVEQSEGNGPIYMAYQNYGDLADAIMIPAGGLKRPCSSETAVEEKDEQGNLRAADHFYMDGEGVFNFVMTKVPPMLAELMAESGDTVNSIDYFMFHQPNKYMVDHLADELDIPMDKCPDNIVGLYGNASTGTIPLNICENVADMACTKKIRLCLSGFGGGLTCNAMILDNPKMEYCKIVDYKPE